MFFKIMITWCWFGVSVFVILISFYAYTLVQVHTSLI